MDLFNSFIPFLSLNSDVNINFTPHFCEKNNCFLLNLIDSLSFWIGNHKSFSPVFQKGVTAGWGSCHGNAHLTEEPIPEEPVRESRGVMGQAVQLSLPEQEVCVAAGATVSTAQLCIHLKHTMHIKSYILCMWSWTMMSYYRITKHGRLTGTRALETWGIVKKLSSR